MLFSDLRDSSVFEIYGGDLGPGRRFSPAALDSANCELRLMPVAPVRSGDIKATFGGVDSTPFPWAGLNASTLGSAINSIPGIAAVGGVNVYGRDTVFTVTGRETGDIGAVTVSGAGAVPGIYSATREVQAGTGTVKEVQLIEVRAAAIQLFDSDDWAAVSAPTFSATVTAGGSGVHEITVIAADRAPAGGTITVTDGSSPTGAVSVFASAQEMEDALNKAHGAGTFRARKPAPFRWEVFREIAGNQTDLTVEDGGVIAFAGIAGTLDRTNVLNYAVGGGPVMARAHLHLEFSDGQEFDVESPVEIPAGDPGV